MRVLLLQPDGTADDLLAVKFRPLALESLAAHLEGHEVCIVDTRVDDEPLANHLAAFAPDLVGVTCTFTMGLRAAQQALAEVREHLPTAKRVVGGVHASLQPGDFGYPLADYVVCGPGERTLAALVAALERGAAIEDVPEVFLVGPQGLHYTGVDPARRPWSETYRLPARALTARYLPYYTPAPDGKSLVLMVSSRGCPYRCTFCAAWKLQGGKLDTRHPQGLLDEILTVDEECLYFFDDNTFANRRVMRELATLLERHGVRKHYQVWTSTNLICADPALLRQWKEVGLFRVFCGLESIRDQRLARLGKRASQAHNDKALEICAQLGIDVTATFIVEQDFSREDFAALASYANRTGVRTPYFFILTPLPGTTLFSEVTSELIEGDPRRYDLMHLVWPPTTMEADTFMAEFVELYLGNASWQQAARMHPVYAQFVRNVERLRQESVPRQAITGFPPNQATLFPLQ